MVAESTADAGESTWPWRWDLLLRFRYIEILALWEGRLTTRHLCESFGIGRQQASKDLATYRRQVGPGNLHYDKHRKGYAPTAAFRPQLTRGVADEYLQLAARNRELSDVFESLSLTLERVEMLHLPLRDVTPLLLRPLLRAAREQRRIEVDYVSVSNPDREGRIIVPHTLVHTGTRWHVRAWCEKNRAYRDFVLSRFRGEPELLDGSSHGDGDDRGWHTPVEIRVTPDPRLSPGQREVVATDYGMRGGQLVLATRGCLVHYALQRLQLDPGHRRSDPIAQQLVVANLPQLRPWLFSG